MTTLSELKVKKSFINLSGLKLVKDIHPAGFNPLTPDILEDIIFRITADLPVQKIILFGSYANQTAEITPDSDLDLLVVMETNDPLSKRILSISRSLRPRPFPMDIIIRTPHEISTLLESNDPFFREIFSAGRMIYERK